MEQSKTNGGIPTGNEPVSDAIANTSEKNEAALITNDEQAATTTMTTTTTAITAPNTHTINLSKSARKKLMKKEFLDQKKRQRKEIEKAAKEEARAQKKAKMEEFQNAMTEEELIAWKTERHERRQNFNDARKAQKEKFEEAIKAGQRILIDLDFLSLMRESELTSLTQQLMYSYAANAKSSKPANLIFCSFNGSLEEIAKRKILGLENWKITMTPQSYMEMFGEERKNELVYLTADSPHELQTLDQDKVYIVGGLVDRNRHKNICFNKAEEQGIATARLPIGDLLSSSQVMCTNHVVEMLIHVGEGKSWSEAFNAVIPQRKRKEGIASDSNGLCSDDHHVASDCVAHDGKE